MSEQLLVRLTKLIEQIQGNVFTYTTKHKETKKHKRFLQKIVFVRCKKKNRHIIIKEEGSKEGDRQEEADVKTPFVKNGYADLKRHQNDENQEDF